MLAVQFYNALIPLCGFFLPGASPSRRRTSGSTPAWPTGRRTSSSRENTCSRQSPSRIPCRLVSNKLLGERDKPIDLNSKPLLPGFHLSATLAPVNGKQSQSTSVTFDRKKIVSCQCSCNSQAEWCSHVVALCLHRIHQVRRWILIKSPT